jgi:hypothetical protein
MVLLVGATSNYVSGVVCDLSHVSTRRANPIFWAFEFGTVFLALAHNEFIFIRCLNLVLLIVIL